MSSLLKKLHIAFLGIAVPSMLLVDLVPFYPPSLYLSPNAPLHFLQLIRTFYITTYNDPYFTQPHPSWFALFTYIELFYQLPMAVYLLWKFATEPRMSGMTELHALVWAVMFAVTTATCVWDVQYWDEEIYSWGQKVEFIGLIYGPFMVLPTIMAVDMFCRLRKRVSVSVTVEKKHD